VRAAGSRARSNAKGRFFQTLSRHGRHALMALRLKQ
jgi:hypothetical protein